MFKLIIRLVKPIWVSTFNQNAQCYFRCLIFFHSKNTSWHIFCGKPGAMSLEAQLLSFSSIVSNHSMLSVEALRLSRVCGESWSCLSVLGLMGSFGKLQNGKLMSEDSRKKSTSTTVHLYRSLLFRNVKYYFYKIHNKQTTNCLATSLIILCRVSF